MKKLMILVPVSYTHLIPVATLTVQIDVFGRFLNTFFQHRADKYAAQGLSLIQI